jgi:hypothetical protein
MAYAGVWWVARFEAREDSAGDVIEVAFATEVIEIGHLTAILGRTARDVARALRRLRARRHR